MRVLTAETYTPQLITDGCASFPAAMKRGPKRRSPGKLRGRNCRCGS